MPFPLMILIWNVRGVGDKSLPRILKNIIQLNHVEVLAVLEPRISGDKAMRVVNGLGFTNHHIVDANGFSGGIWLLWNCSNIHLNIVACSSQSITAMITQEGHNHTMTPPERVHFMRSHRHIFRTCEATQKTTRFN
ncbi:unnamed protein product [Prunus armeniaca]